MGAIGTNSLLISAPSMISNKSEFNFLDDNEWNARTYFKWLASSQGEGQGSYSNSKCCSFHKVLCFIQRYLLPSMVSAVPHILMHSKMRPQTSEEMKGLLDINALNREVRRLKKQTLSQAKQILKLKAKLKKLSKFVQPVVKHHAFWVENQNLKKQKNEERSKRKK
ncbi:hypothetical protein Tco_0937603 [Tanacetum coccineum]|uniref:Uncharacterized protein n=1 Tax=Tanacetum coccineum TaxID=301880 RepID=A0ABQ5DHH8_9ASTR